jgi:hypothetical protein
MNLPDFIKETLIQIARGIEGAAAELKGGSGLFRLAERPSTLRCHTLGANSSLYDAYRLPSALHRHQ